MNPTARTDGLTTKKLGDELVVFDATTGSVHYLNRVAEVVFRSCDGRTDAAALARIAGRATGVPDAGPAVELALEQLSRRGLLATPVERAGPDRRRDRRQALKQLAAALAVPTVLTLTAGRARAQSASLPVTGGSCTFTCPPGTSVAGLPGATTGIGTLNASGTCVPIVPCSATVITPVVDCTNQPDGTVCLSGTCCGGACRSPATFQTDPFNCGTCGRVCETFQSCVNGQCVGQG